MVMCLVLTKTMAECGGQCGAGPGTPHPVSPGAATPVETIGGGPRTNVTLASNDSHVCQPLAGSIHHHTTRMSTKRLVSDYYPVKMNELEITDQII